VLEDEMGKKNIPQELRDKWRFEAATAFMVQIFRHVENANNLKAGNYVMAWVMADEFLSAMDRVNQAKQAETPADDPPCRPDRERPQFLAVEKLGPYERATAP
jgi:cell division protein YceG involved in septum cleavage